LALEPTRLLLHHFALPGPAALALWHFGRGEAHRDYAVKTGQRIRAKNNAMACDSAGGTLDDFLKFCPGAGKIDVL
jgi:hypothetical protein